jgi:hypothetical protein
VRLNSRHDLKWSWGANETTWPSVYQLAAYTGNGLYGVTAMVDAGGASLRFDVARTDVYDCGLLPRMSIGSARLGFAGSIPGMLTQEAKGAPLPSGSFHSIPTHFPLNLHTI